MQKQPPEVLYKKAVVEKIAILTEKHLCWSPFFIRNIAKFFRAATLKSIWERLLLKMCSWKWENKKLFIRNFNFILMKQVKIFVFMSWKKQVKMFAFISWLVSFGVYSQIHYFCDVERKKLQRINIYWS